MLRIGWLAVLVASGVGFARAAENSADRFFKPEGPLHVIKVEVDRDNLEQLQRDPRKYVKCRIKIDGTTLRDVGIHIKGAAGSTRPWEDKPALTVAFDRNRREQYFRGMDKIHLNNSVQDPRYMTEILGAKMMLAAGVPTPRGTHALVELNGRKAGLYVVKESFDKVFLKTHFGSAAGNLYDGGFLADIDSALKRTQGDGDVDDRSDLQTAARAARERNLAERFAKVEKLVDVDRFMLMAAIEVATAHWDGYAPHKNNYRVYHDLKTGKLVFMPHGMDQLWGDPNFPIQPNFEGLIARKLMETPEGRERYRAALQKVMDEYYKVDDLKAEIDRRLAWLKEGLTGDNEPIYRDLESQCRGLKTMIRMRADYIRKELEKK